MGTLEQRIQAFVKLGEFLRNFRPKEPNPAGAYEGLNAALEQARLKNGWFTDDNLMFALHSWGELLTEKNINEWLAPYSIPKKEPKDIAIIMAGNIPLVGFHDLLSVLITGNKALIKMASSDSDLLPFIVGKLEEFEPSLLGSVTFTKGILKDFDAVIATGSDNTSRYFDYYFGKKPNIIRKNRNSVAVVSGDESTEQLEDLGEDIFRYFGLGCRSVSKLFVPEGYNFEAFFKAIDSYQYLTEHHKYHNNYDYNKAVYLMSEFDFLDNGFFLLKEDEQYASPIGTVFFEYYSSRDVLAKKLSLDHEKIQCVVAKDFTQKEVQFGHTQKPSLSDYADGIDTVEFLLKT